MAPKKKILQTLFAACAIILPFIFGNEHEDLLRQQPKNKLALDPPAESCVAEEVIGEGKQQKNENSALFISCGGFFE